MQAAVALVARLALKARAAYNRPVDRLRRVEWLTRQADRLPERQHKQTVRVARAGVGDAAHR